MIGAGGWAYFNIPGMDPLEAYSLAFDFVEVNSTFYQLPSDNTINSWAAKVPGNFRFSRLFGHGWHNDLQTPWCYIMSMISSGILVIVACQTLRIIIPFMV